MYSLEFEADIENGIMHVPESLGQKGRVHAKVSILVDDGQAGGSFEPKNYYGLGNAQKQEIDAYLASSRNNW